MEPLPGGTPATVCVILDLLDEVDETCPHLVQSCRTLHESSSTPYAGRLSRTTESF